MTLATTPAGIAIVRSAEYGMTPIGSTNSNIRRAIAVTARSSYERPRSHGRRNARELIALSAIRSTALPLQTRTTAWRHPLPVTERTRHELHEILVELMGPDRAETLMESLPPVGWGDVATKEYLDLRFKALEHKMEALEHRVLGEMDSRLRSQMAMVIGMMVSQTALILTFLIALR